MKTHSLTMNLWRNRVAIVTVVDSGIGVEIAKQLARIGMTVVGLSTGSSVEVPEDVRKNLHISLCDTLSKEYVAKTFAKIEEKFGCCDVLVNNTSFYHASLREFEAEVFKTMRQNYDSNILRMILCTQEALKSMKRRSFDGHVININNFVTPITGKKKNPYPAKFAIAAITEMFRHELPENSRIKITNIESGHILTDPEPPLVAIKGQIIPHLFAKDICDAVRYSLDTSPITNIQEIILKPFRAG